MLDGMPIDEGEKKTIHGGVGKMLEAVTLPDTIVAVSAYKQLVKFGYDKKGDAGETPEGGGA